MDLTHDDVEDILRLVEASSIEYLEIEVEGMRLVTSRSGITPAPAATEPGPSLPTPETSPTAPAHADPVVDSSRERGTDPGAHLSGVAAEEGLITITAPIVGIFYASPEPGSDPFVGPGDRISAGATIALIEVMKIFNSVTAEVAGEVAEILVDNEDFVEFGQPLFRIRPDDDR